MQAAAQAGIEDFSGIFRERLRGIVRASGVMRQPLEDGHVTIARAAGSLTFPARFMLIAALNPCPQGFALGTRPA